MNDQIKTMNKIKEMIYVVSGPINLSVTEIHLKDKTFPVRHFGLSVIKDSAPSRFTVRKSHSSGNYCVEKSQID